MARLMGTTLLALLLVAAAAAGASASHYDYGGAFDKCLQFLEAQRSGKLPADRRVQWRGDSALADGFSQGVRASIRFDMFLCIKQAEMLCGVRLGGAWTGGSCGRVLRLG